MAQSNFSCTFDLQQTSQMVPHHKEAPPASSSSSSSLLLNQCISIIVIIIAFGSLCFNHHQHHLATPVESLSRLLLVNICISQSNPNTLLLLASNSSGFSPAFQPTKASITLKIKSPRELTLVISQGAFSSTPCVDFLLEYGGESPQLQRSW